MQKNKYFGLLFLMSCLLIQLSAATQVNFTAASITSSQGNFAVGSLRTSFGGSNLLVYLPINKPASLIGIQSGLTVVSDIADVQGSLANFEFAINWVKTFWGTPLPLSDVVSITLTIDIGSFTNLYFDSAAGYYRDPADTVFTGVVFKFVATLSQPPTPTTSTSTSSHSRTTTTTIVETPTIDMSWIIAFVLIGVGFIMVGIIFYLRKQNPALR
jgi:hypothetical protein